MRVIEQSINDFKRIIRKSGFDFSLIDKNKLLTVSIVAVSLLLFESSFLEWFKIFGVRPNLAVCFIVLLSFTQKPAVSLSMVLLAGIIKDSFSGFVFGMNTVSFFITMILCLEVKKKLFAQKIGIFIFMAFLGIWISFLFFCFYSLIYELDCNFTRFFWVVFVESLYSSLIFFPILKYLKKCVPEMFT